MDRELMISDPDGSTQIQILFHNSFNSDLIKLRPLKNFQFCSIFRRAQILTTGIHEVFRGLKFVPNTEMAQKGMFFKGLNFLLTSEDEMFR
jgi:hypothetical protein